ncbi:zinc finger protein Aiolos-like isoform X2 [Nelusetta ayraudi]|uniref:zinc finger protein Aiolos-like isoform X2 n=1 Tax=Nelusetta ayraudi TaxID=303726 RepID=UPI003F71DF08
MMNADKCDLTTAEGNGMDVCRDAAGVKPQEEEEEEGERKDNSFSGGAEPAEGAIKTEVEETEMEMEEAEGHPKLNPEGAFLLKAEAEVSEDGMEDGYDDERTEEDEEEEEEEEEERDGEAEEEADALNEPQNLSLADYSRYDGGAREVAVDSASASGAAVARAQPPGKLNCDICGLSCVSINVLLVHKRSHTGERPFHCSQCGASFTQKGNLLRHIKLHSGEKPFKCPMCSYACRRRDALSGHLRTHSVEKPFKCNHCSRSYKQRSSLEEHRERCHVYIQSKGPAERAEDGPTARANMGSERALLLDRLASNVAKRKSTMPQKFTGDNAVCLDLSFNKELLQRSDNVKDPPTGSPGPDGHHQDSEAVSSHRPSYSLPLGRSTASMGLTNGHKMGLHLLGLPHATQPPLGMDSFHHDGSPLAQPVVYSLGHLLGGGLGHQNGLPHHPHPQPHSQPVPLSPLEALRAGRSDGEAGAVPGAVYPCAHCRVVFLDYVMFTIHMGCHGFRDPLECNVCGHRSQDRYEFSSHIARGEHRLELK